MIDINTARKIAAEYVRQTSEQGELECMLIEEPLTTGDYGWVFGYNSVEYLKTGCIRSQLLGNAPIIVSKKTGSVIVTGTARSLEFYVSNYLEFGDPHLTPGRTVALLGSWRKIEQPITVVRMLRSVLGIELAQAKSYYEDSINGKVVELRLPSIDAAQELVAELEKLGLIVKQLPQQTTSIGQKTEM